MERIRLVLSLPVVDLARRDTLALLAGILVVGNGTVSWLTSVGWSDSFLAAVMGHWRPSQCGGTAFGSGTDRGRADPPEG
jgi:hypothetical protein